MMRRSLHIALHWGLVFLILAMVKGGTAAPWVRWSFVVATMLWVGIALAKGLIGRPSPRLSIGLRAAYPWVHRALYALLGMSALLNLAELTGLISPGAAWVTLLLLFGLGMLHGLFQIWRHMALYDNALRLITPRFLHHIL